MHEKNETIKTPGYYLLEFPVPDLLLDFDAHRRTRPVDKLWQHFRQSNPWPYRWTRGQAARGSGYYCLQLAFEQRREIINNKRLDEISSFEIIAPMCDNPPMMENHNHIRRSSISSSK
jgi:hypothetical protein